MNGMRSFGWVSYSALKRTNDGVSWTEKNAHSHMQAGSLVCVSMQEHVHVCVRVRVCVCACICACVCACVRTPARALKECVLSPSHNAGRSADGRRRFGPQGIDCRRSEALEDNRTLPHLLLRYWHEEMVCVYVVNSKAPVPSLKNTDRQTDRHRHTDTDTQTHTYTHTQTHTHTKREGG